MGCRSKPPMVIVITVVRVAVGGWQAAATVGETDYMDTNEDSEGEPG